MDGDGDDPPLRIILENDAKPRAFPKALFATAFLTAGKQTAIRATVDSIIVQKTSAETIPNKSYAGKPMTVVRFIASLGMPVWINTVILTKAAAVAIEPSKKHPVIDNLFVRLKLS